MRIIHFLLVIILCASSVWAGPEMLLLVRKPNTGPFTSAISSTGSFSIPIDWYQEATAITQGATVTLRGGGGGGIFTQSGLGGDLVSLLKASGEYYAYIGMGGLEGGTGTGGTGYQPGAAGTSGNGGGGGSTAITSSQGGALIAQAKGGDGNAGALGGGTSSGGTVTVGGANNGGALNGGNGSILLTYYTDPGNFQLSTFSTGNDGWTFSGTAIANVTSSMAYLYEESYNTNEYSVQKTITTRAGVMTVTISASDGGNTGVTGQFHVTIGGTTYNLNSGGTTVYKFSVPAGTITIKFWFTGHALYHYSMSVDNIKVPVP